MSELEIDFEEVKKQISDKLAEAEKLIREANELAYDKLKLTLHGADQNACYELQNLMEDVGFVTEREWDSSGCSF